MHLILIGGKSANEMSNKLKSNFDNLNVSVYSSMGGFVEASGLKTMTIDRFILIQDALNKEESLDEKLVYFNEYICKHYPEARFISISKEEAMLDKISSIFLSPYMVHIIAGSMRATILYDLVSQPIDVVRKKYGNLVKSKSMDGVIEEVFEETPPEPEKPEEKPTSRADVKKKKGLFGGLFGKKKKKGKQEPESTFEAVAVPAPREAVVAQPVVSEGTIDTTAGLGESIVAGDFEKVDLDESALPDISGIMKEEEEEQDGSFGDFNPDDKELEGIDLEGLEVTSLDGTDLSELSEDDLEDTKEDWNEVAEEIGSILDEEEEKQGSTETIKSPAPFIEVDDLDFLSDIDLKPEVIDEDIPVEEIIMPEVGFGLNIDKPYLVDSTSLDTELQMIEEFGDTVNKMSALNQAIKPSMEPVPTILEPIVSIPDDISDMEDVAQVHRAHIDIESLENQYEDSKKQTVIVEKPVIIEKEVEKIVEKVVEKEVEKIVHVEKEVEKIVHVEKVVEKEVEKIVHVNQKGKEIKRRKGVRNIIVTGDRRSGLTTTALKLAEVFSKEEKTLYVDFDLLRKGSVMYFGLDKVVTEEERVLEGLKLLRNTTMLENVIYSPYNVKFDALISMYGVTLSDEDADTAQRVLSTQRQYSTVVIDCPIENLHYLEDILIYSDVLVCVESELTSVINTINSLSNVFEGRTKEKNESLLFNNSSYFLTKGSDAQSLQGNLTYVHDMFSLSEEYVDFSKIKYAGDKKGFNNVLNMLF